jgi:hypothetical protein
MKFLKNTIAILGLCIIGYTHTKQMEKKSTTSPVTTSSSAPSSAQSSRGHGKATEDRPHSQKQLQQLHQKGTFREFLNEIRNMKTNDVLTPDRSQFTDRVVRLIARAKISLLEQLELNNLLDA